MKMLLFIFMGCFILGCQKENSESNSFEFSTYDSIVGEWKHMYDYRLTATQANPDVIIDSCCGHVDIYSPLSYMRLNGDSTFSQYLSEMETNPSIGYSHMGKWRLNTDSRELEKFIEKESTDHYGPNTVTYSPALTGPAFKIKFLSEDSLVTYFRTPAPDNKYYYSYDVYVR